MNRERKNLIFSFLLIGACIALAVTFRSTVLAVDPPALASEAGGGRAATPVQYVNPVRQDIRRAVRMAADIKPDREAMIYGKVSGYVLPDPVEVGTRVDPTGANGATRVLVRIAVPDLDARVLTETSRVARAEASVTEAEAGIVQAQAAVVGAQQGAAEARAMARRASGMIEVAHADVAEARAEFDLRKRIADRLEKVLADSPNLVAQDQVDQARGALGIAEAKQDAARIGVSKAQDDEAVAQAQVAGAVAGVSAAEARVAAARANLAAAQADVGLAGARKVEAETLRGFATIHAPFAGVVADRMCDTGDLVKDARRNSGATPLFRIVADSKLRVRFYIAEPDAPACRVGAKVELQVDVLEDKAFDATITRIADALDPKTRTMEVEAELQNPKDAAGRNLLRTGMFARVKVFLEVHRGVLVLPARCITTKKRKSSVMVVADDDTVKIVPIVIGADNGLHVEVRSGIDENARVVVRGRNTVSKGEKVIPHEATSQKATSQRAGDAKGGN